MEHEVREMLGSLQASVEQLMAALATHAGSLATSGAVGKITAAVDEPERQRREDELERRLNEAVTALDAMRANAEQAERKAGARKTLPTATVQLLAKQGIDVADSVDLGSLDAALAGMPVEQRIAIKGQLMRTGALAL